MYRLYNFMYGCYIGVNINEVNNSDEILKLLIDLIGDIG